MTKPTDRVLVSTADHVGWVTLNNAERHNAISLDMWHALGFALDTFEQDQDVRVVVLAGAGGKAFASGADITQFEDQRKNAEQSENFSRASRGALRKLDAFPKPIIARIDGYCIGGGVRLAAGCDIRVASSNAVFAIPAAKLGLGYSFDSVEKLVRLVGEAATRDILFTGRRFDAAEALRLGLVSRVVVADDIARHVRDLACEIAANAPLTVRAAKLAIDAAAHDATSRDMTRVDAAVRACFDSRDYAEGRKAFKEKRKPDFSGT